MKKDSYHIPQETRIGHVHLKVSDLQKSLDFYCGLLGFKLTQMYGDQAAFVSAGGYHHHIGLNTWQSQNFPPANRDGVGLYHLAILYPTQKDLATIYKRLHLHSDLRIGASDHGVSQALYIRDPDDNGVELYWDRPKEEWPKTSEGELAMFTKPLRLKELLELAD
ncbi:VOC family protein [Mesonia mobilis]|uniref:Glyoxalase n=1 Tax=Mesonia mobilis TaxID=369791 RepID=A0ABQ3C177_9FLAO|nr:VOC family protein [Mesonia mobilis]MBQ0737237.1 VOC family protein [Aquimarina celericrescens]GGZ63454.1 glyoxalase [Mesonia mobilis]